MFAPSADSSTGTAAPMAMPITIGSATPKEIAPVTESACRMPIAAEALCSTLVNTRPTRMPSRGLENDVST